MFIVGDKVNYSGLYGERYFCEIVKRENKQITLKEAWVAEDINDVVSAENVYNINVSEDGREYITIWEYKGYEGRVYSDN